MNQNRTCCDGPETLLTCCIPDLQFDSLSIKLDCSDLKINTGRPNRQATKQAIYVIEEI
jgi:hypothetical protein